MQRVRFGTSGAQRASLLSEGRPGPVCRRRSLRSGLSPLQCLPRSHHHHHHHQKKRKWRDEGPAQPHDSGISLELGRLCFAVAPTFSLPRPSKTRVCSNLQCSRTAGAIRNGSGPLPKRACRPRSPAVGPSLLSLGAFRGDPIPAHPPYPVTSQNVRDFGQLQSPLPK